MQKRSAEYESEIQEYLRVIRQHEKKIDTLEKEVDRLKILEQELKKLKEDRDRWSELEDGLRLMVVKLHAQNNQLKKETRTFANDHNYDKMQTIMKGVNDKIHQIR